MPLTKKGKKIRASMKRFYGKDKIDGESVFYASINAGKVKGAEIKKRKHKKK